jgi:hypothetical protein
MGGKQCYYLKNSWSIMEEKQKIIYGAYEDLLSSSLDAGSILEIFKSKGDPINWNEPYNNQKTMLDHLIDVVHKNYNGQGYENIWDYANQQKNESQEISAKIRSAIEGFLSRTDESDIYSHIFKTTDESVWEKYASQKKDELLLLAIRGNHVEAAKKLISVGADVNQETECKTSAAYYRSQHSVGPCVASVRSSEMLELLLKNGADAKKSMEDGESLSSFVRKKDRDVFVNGENDRKKCWTLIDQIAIEGDNTLSGKINLMKGTIDRATTTPAMRHSLKILKKENWRDHKFPGGGSLIHFMAYRQSERFAVFAKDFKLTKEDLLSIDDGGASVIEYFMCGTKIHNGWDREGCQLWIQAVDLFSKAQAVFTIDSKDGLNNFERSARHILKHMEPLKTHRPLQAFTASPDHLPKLLNDINDIVAGTGSKDIDMLTITGNWDFNREYDKRKRDLDISNRILLQKALKEIEKAQTLENAMEWENLAQKYQEKGWVMGSFLNCFMEYGSVIETGKAGTDLYEIQRRREIFKYMVEYVVKSRINKLDQSNFQEKWPAISAGMKKKEWEGILKLFVNKSDFMKTGCTSLTELEQLIKPLSDVVERDFLFESLEVKGTPEKKPTKRSI